MIENDLTKLDKEVGMIISDSAAALQNSCFGITPVCDKTCEHAEICGERYLLFMGQGEIELTRKGVNEEIENELVVLAAPEESERLTVIVIEDKVEPVATSSEIILKTKRTPRVKKEVGGFPKSRIGFDWAKGTDALTTIKPVAYRSAAKIIRAMLPEKQRTSAYGCLNIILTVLNKEGVIVWDASGLTAGARQINWI